MSSSHDRLKGVASAALVGVVCALTALAPSCVRTLPQPPLRSERVREGMAPRLFWMLQLIERQTSVTFEATDVSPGANPVLHLLKATSASQWSEVAFAESRDGAPARLSYTATSAGFYVLLVRAASLGETGQCTVVRDGTQRMRNIPVAGWRERFAQVQAGEEISAVPLTGGPKWPLLAALDPATGHIRDLIVGSEATTMAFSTSGAVEILSGHVLDNSHSGAGKMRLVQNDARLPGHDSDDDGLGDELEAMIPTCATATDHAGLFDCALAADPKDSDGDGLSDRWEVLGHPSRDPLVSLPRFGADPRHKDLFVEMDFKRSAPLCSEPGHPDVCDPNVDRTLDVAIAKEVSDFYEDRVGAATSAERKAHATSLRNPDGLPGIRIHLDTGRAAEATEDRVLYGDWGGHNVVPMVVGEDGKLKAPEPAAAMLTNMAPVRRGVFHYAMTYPGTGGGAVPGSAVALPMDNAAVLAHELGHSLNLQHEGRPGEYGNCRPNYPSIMNYAFLGAPAVGSSRVGFSGGGRASMLAQSLRERGAVAPSDSIYLDQLEQVFELKVDRANGHVDWNRDGVFSEEPVRAYANFTRYGEGCEGTVERARDVVGDAWAGGPAAPSLVRHGAHLAMIYKALDGQLRFSFGDGELKCNADAGPEPCSGPTPPEVSSGVSGAAMASVVEGGQAKLLLVVIDGAGGVRESTLGDGASAWSAWRTIGADASAEPALIALPAATHLEALLAYRGRDGNVRPRERRAGAWQPERVILSSTPADASPALLYAQLPWDSEPKSYLALTDAQDRKLALLSRIAAQGWRKEPRFTFASEPSFGKPAMAMADRFYLLYSRYAPNPDGTQYRMARSFAREPGAYEVGLDAPVRNVWWRPAQAAAQAPMAPGVSLQFDEGKDDNVRALFLRTADEYKSYVYLFPQVDGRVDATLVSSDDWAWLAQQLCRWIGGDTVRCFE
jgi:hypothetical protein